MFLVLNMVPWHYWIIVNLDGINIVYVIESAAYGVIFRSCLCENPNERGTSE